MNPSTASNRLVKDILFSYVAKHNPLCYRCGKPLTRETFTVEHKEPWLDNEDPVKMFFDLDNISFSHHSCNRKEARSGNKKYYTPEEKRAASNRIDREFRERQTPEQRKKRRRDQYLRTGK